MLDEYIAEGVDHIDEVIAVVLLFADLDRIDVLLKIVELGEKLMMLVNVAAHNAFAQLLFKLGK
jgi:hypothetical protein